jgi:hypothetical protein
MARAERAAERAVAEAVAGIDEPALVLAFPSGIDVERAAADAQLAVAGAPWRG